MCTGSAPKAPTPPPREPEAAQTPLTPSRRKEGGDLQRRQRAQGQAGTGTILTGARGVSGGAATASKTLLGQ